MEPITDQMVNMGGGGFGPKALYMGSTAYAYGCIDNSYSVYGLSYSHVHGRIIAYQTAYPIAYHFINYV